jgi:DNA-binding transcriptional ArsR family regulator
MRCMLALAMRIEDAASRLEALGNPTRLRIYRTLVKAGHPGLPVGKLQTASACRRQRSLITSRRCSSWS